MMNSNAQDLSVQRRSFFWGGFFYFSFFIPLGFYEPFLYPYLDNIGFSGIQIGILSSILPASTLIIAPLIANKADRLNHRRLILTAGLLGVALATMALGVSRSFLGLFCFILVRDILFCGLNPIGDSLVTSMAIRYHLDFGKIRLWGSVAFAISTICAGFVFDRIGYAMIFLLTGMLFLPAVGGAAKLEEQKLLQSKTEDTKINIFGNRYFLVLIISSFIIGASIYMSWIFEGIYMESVSGSALMVGALIGLSTICEIPMMRFTLPILRKVGNRITLWISCAILVVSMICLGISANPLQVLVAGAIKGVGFGLFMVSTVMIVSECAPKHLSSTYQGIHTAATWGLGPMVAGLVSGIIYDYQGPRMVFLVAGGLVAMAAIILANQPKKQEPI